VYVGQPTPPKKNSTGRREGKFIPEKWGEKIKYRERRKNTLTNQKAKRFPPPSKFLGGGHFCPTGGGEKTSHRTCWEERKGRNQEAPPRTSQRPWNNLSSKASQMKMVYQTGKKGREKGWQILLKGLAHRRKGEGGIDWCRIDTFSRAFRGEIMAC